MLSGIVLKVADERHLPFAMASVVLGALFAAAAQPVVPFGGEIISAALRASALFAMGICGLFASAQVGLRFWTDDSARAWRAAFASALAVTIFVVALDCYLFRKTLTPNYVTILQLPLLPRLAFYAVRAYVENIVYRLFAMSVLVLLLGMLWRKADGSPSDGAFWVAIILSQLANIVWNLVLFEPVTPLVLGYDMIRYVAPGLLWGYLFWRYGFATAEIAHVATHFFLQPTISILFL